MGFLRIVVLKVVQTFESRPCCKCLKSKRFNQLQKSPPVIVRWKIFQLKCGLESSSFFMLIKAELCRNVGCGPSLRSWGLGHAGLFRNKNCHPLFAPHIYDPQDFTLIDPLPKKIILTPSPLWLCPLTAVNTSSAGTGKSEYSILLAHFRASLMQ